MRNIFQMTDIENRGDPVHFLRQFGTLSLFLSTLLTS